MDPGEAGSGRSPVPAAGFLRRGLQGRAWSRLLEVLGGVQQKQQAVGEVGCVFLVTAMHIFTSEAIVKQ